MYFNVKYASSDSSPSPTPMRSAVIHVAGLSGSRPSRYEGPGKSCLCYRFVYPSEADFISEHSSVLSLSEFEGEVLLGEHSVYWGPRTLSLQQKKGKAKEEQVTVEVVEHTEFLQDITNAPFRVDSKQSYAERAVKGKIKGGKQSFKAREFLGFPDEYNSVVAPAKMNQMPRGLLLAVDCSRGGNCLHEYFQKQLHLIEEILSLKKKDKGSRAVEAAIVATKCDELDDDRIADVEKLSKRFKVPLYQCSAKENASVVECFATLAAHVLKMTVEPTMLQKAMSIEMGMGSTLQTITMMRNSLRSYLSKRVTKHVMTYAELERAEELIEAKEVLGALEPFDIFLQHMVTIKVQELASSDSLTVAAVRKYIVGHPDMCNNEAKCMAIATQVMETTGHASPSPNALSSPPVSSTALQPYYDSGFDTDSVSTRTPYSLSTHTSFSLPLQTPYLPVTGDPNEADRSSSDDGELCEGDSSPPKTAFMASTFQPPSSPHMKPPHCHPRRDVSPQTAQKVKGSDPDITPKPNNSLQGDTAPQANPGSGCDTDVASPSPFSSFLGDTSVTIAITSGDILSTQHSSTPTMPPSPTPLPRSVAAKAVELPSVPSAIKEKSSAQRGVSSSTPTQSQIEVQENVAIWGDGGATCLIMEDVYDAPFSLLPNDPPPPLQPTAVAANVQEKTITPPPPVMVKAHVYDEAQPPTAPPPVMVKVDKTKTSAPPPPVMVKAHVYDEAQPPAAPPPVGAKVDETKTSTPPPPVMVKTRVYDEAQTPTAPPPVSVKVDKTKTSTPPPPVMVKARVYDEAQPPTALPPVGAKIDKTKTAAPPPPIMVKTHVYDEAQPPTAPPPVGAKIDKTKTSTPPPPVMVKARVYDEAQTPTALPPVGAKVDKTKTSTPPPPVMVKARVYDEAQTPTAPPPVSAKVHVLDKTKTSAAPPPVMVKAHVYDEAQPPAAPPQPVLMKAHSYDETTASAVPPKLVAPMTHSTKDVADTRKSTGSPDTPRQPNAPIPLPKPPAGRKSPEPPPKPTRKTITKPPVSTTSPSINAVTESSTSSSAAPSAKKGGRIAQLQKQLQNSGSDSPSVPAVHNKKGQQSPLLAAPDAPMVPCHPLLPPQNHPESFDSDDSPVPIPPRNYDEDDVGDVLPAVPPRQYLVDQDDNGGNVSSLVSPRNHDDGSLVEPEYPVIPARNYTREDIYGGPPAVATTSSTENRPDSPELPPQIPDRNYSMSEVLGPSSDDRLVDERPPSPLSDDIDIDSRPPMPLPSEPAPPPSLEPPLLKPAAPGNSNTLLQPATGVLRKANTLPDRRTQTLESRPLPALPFDGSSTSFGVESSSHQYCDPDSVIPENVKQATPPTGSVPGSYLPPTATQPQPFNPPFNPLSQRSASEDLSSPPIPQKQSRNVLISSHSFDAPPSLPPKSGRKPAPAVPSYKPSEDAMSTSRSRAVTAKELPLPAIPGLSVLSHYTSGATGAGGHSYDYVESWMWRQPGTQATPPRQQAPARNPFFPSIEEILANKIMRPSPNPAPVPPRHPAMRKPPVPIPAEDEEYEEMESEGGQFQVSVERQVFQQLPTTTTVSQLSYSHYCNTAPVQAKKESAGYVPVDEPFRDRADTIDSLGYVPMDCPPELAEFIRQKLRQDQARFGNLTQETASLPPMQVVAMDLESVEYYNVQRNRGGRQHMLDYLDVQSSSHVYGNVPPPRPPKQPVAPPRPPKQPVAPPRPPKQPVAPPLPPKGSTLPGRTVKLPPQVPLLPKPVDRSRAARPVTPPSVICTPQPVSVPPRNIVRKGQYVFEI